MSCRREHGELLSFRRLIGDLRLGSSCDIQGRSLQPPDLAGDRSVAPGAIPGVGLARSSTQLTAHKYIYLLYHGESIRFESSSLMRGVSGDGPWRSGEWRSAAAARNCRLGRHGNRSPDTTTRPRGASLHALRRIMPEPEARTRRPKIATAERREARVPDRKGTRGASQAPRRAARNGTPGVPRKHPAPSRRSTPSGEEGFTPRRRG
jgi:hypothetical protein